MTEEQTALARRLVEHDRWQWAAMDGVLQVAKGQDDYRTHLVYMASTKMREWLPDLGDDATGGVLLGMLVATGRDFAIHAPPNLISGGWDIDFFGADYHDGDTLAEACAHALLAVWGE